MGKLVRSGEDKLARSGEEKPPLADRERRERGFAEEFGRPVGRLTCQLWDKRDRTNETDSPSMPKTNDVVCGALC
jgi:hypothetical protein